MTNGAAKTEESRALDILADCVGKLHDETMYRSFDTARGVGRKLAAVRRILRRKEVKK